MGCGGGRVSVFSDSPLVACGGAWGEHRGYDLRGSNILFTNGDADPWHTLSITKDLPAPAGVRAVTYAAGAPPPTPPRTNMHVV